MQRGYVGFPFPSKRLDSVTTPSVSTIKTGEAISSGSIVSVSDDGLAYYASDPSSVSGVNRPVYSPTKQYTTYTNTQNYLYDVNGGRIQPYISGVTMASPLVASALLTNGYTAVVWQEKNSPWRVMLAILNENMAQVGNATVVTSFALGTATWYSLSVTALTGGGFVVAMAISVSPYIQFAVYGNTGSVVTALTTVSVPSATGYTANSDRIVVAGLSNGGFVIVNDRATAAPSGVYYTVYSATGTVTKATANISASGVSSATGIVAVKPFTATQGGGFLIMWRSSGGFSTIAKYNNAGTQTIAPVSCCSVSAGSYNCAIFPSGGYATVTIGSAGGGEVKSFDSTGTLLYTSSISSTGGSFFPLIEILSTGNFAITHGMSAGATDLSYFPAVGTGSPTAYATVTHNTIPLGYTNSNLGAKIFPNQIGGVDYISCLQTGYFFDGSCNLINTTSYSTIFAVPTSISAGYYVDYAPTYMANSNVGVRGITSYSYILMSSGGYLVAGFMLPYIPQLIPVGVSTSSASSGGILNIAVSGVASLTTPFTIPYSANANAIGGQKISVIGSSANLQGVTFSTTASLS